MPSPCGQTASPWCRSQWSQSTAPHSPALLACLTLTPVVQALQVPVGQELSLPKQGGQHDTSWHCAGYHHLTSDTMRQHPFAAPSMTPMSCPYIGWSFAGTLWPECIRKVELLSRSSSEGRGQSGWPCYLWCTATPIPSLCMKSLSSFGHPGAPLILKKFNKQEVKMHLLVIYW